MRCALRWARHMGGIIRQLLTESLLLTLVGGVLGVAVAATGVRVLVALMPPGLQGVNAITVDGSIYVFAFGVTAVIGTLVGLIPAFEATRADLNTGMRQASKGMAGGRHRMRSVLVVVEVSLAVVLLVGAGLLLRTMRHLLGTDPGFEASHVLTMQVQDSGRRNDTDATTLLFFHQALERVRGDSGRGFGGTHNAVASERRRRWVRDAV